MLDRASTFANPEIVALLKSRFIPVAIDQALQRRQQDPEGEFYRRIAGQGPRSDFEQTTQGLYTAAADGTLLAYNNHRHPDVVLRMMRQALNDFSPGDAAPIDRGSVDPRYSPQLPANGLVVRVRAKVLSGYPKTDDRWQRIFQAALSRDNLWITGAEHEQLVQGQFPDSLRDRIARFHLVDNTRGEPPFWNADEIQECAITLRDGRITGRAHLKTRDDQRAFDADLLGFVESTGQQITRFDIVVKGLFRGAGRYTGNAPPGNFPLAISFSLADGADIADKLAPQGSRGWLKGYLRNER